MAGVVFGLVSDRTKFYISAGCGLAGAAVTALLVPDISGLDLSEGASTPGRAAVELLVYEGTACVRSMCKRSAVGSMLNEHMAAVYRGPAVDDGG